MKEEMVKAAELLLKLADENKALKAENAELKTQKEALEKEAKAVKIASLMAERGLIEADSIHEKVASLVEEDNLEAHEVAVDLVPQDVSIGTVVKEEEKTASVAPVGEEVSPLEAVLLKHMGKAS